MPPIVEIVAHSPAEKWKFGQRIVGNSLSSMVISLTVTMSVNCILLDVTLRAATRPESAGYPTQPRIRVG